MSATNHVPASSEADLLSLVREMVGAQPPLAAGQQQIVVGLYRMFAEGNGVVPQTLADHLDVSLDAVDDALRRWPGVERDSAGRITGMGLTTETTQHRVNIGPISLYAYCALETMFIPAILNQTVEVASLSPSGGTVSVRLTPHELLSSHPETAVITLVRPSDRLGDDVRRSYCCYVHFFLEPSSAEAWTQRVDGAFALSVEDAATFGRLLAHRLFSDVLDPPNRLRR